MEQLPLPALILAAAGVLLLLLLALWLLLARAGPKHRLPYSKRGPLLTAGELRFYRALLPAVPSGLAVFLKVRLLDLVSVPDRHWHRYGAPASGMHVDFVLADPASAEPRLVIELDDRSHQRPEARKRDAFKNAALGSAGIPLLRVSVASRYDMADLRGTVRKALVE
jgi:hypothetical protein